MANWYIRSGAAGTASGADWTNAKLTLGAAFTAGAAGDSFYVSEDHAETQASANVLTPPGTTASPCFVYCVNHAGTVPPVSADLATTATISTTGANSLLLDSGFAYFYGLTLNAGNGASTANLVIQNSGINSAFTLEACVLALANSSASSQIQLGANAAVGSNIRFINTKLSFGSTSQSVKSQGTKISWRNTASAISGSVPTTLFTSGGNPSVVVLEAVDLSAATAGKTLVAAIVSPSIHTFKDCKLGASVTVAATPTSHGGVEVNLIRCDSGATNYRTEKYHYAGTQTVETTIVRTGGASDGTTSIAWKLVTTANSKWVLPFEALPIAIWNDSTASVTVTVYGIWGGGAVPLNDEIWMDVEYLGSALTPQGSFATSTKADNLATGTNTTTDTSTWGGSTTKFKMTATFTPAQKGAMYIYLKAAKASSTFYIDPKPVLS